jgi:phage recombination protein Bet
MNNELMKIEFKQDQVELIKKQIAPNANDNELKLFLYQAQRTGLDPLTRQIYCIHRGGKMTIQTSIDGFRVIAERSGDYAGQDEPVFNEVDGKLISCKVTVYRFKGDQRYPAAVGVAYMTEYNAGGPMWQKMPHTMLSKCAEAVALRKAYPQDLSGLYTGDEMNQADGNQDVSFDEVVDESDKALLRDLVFSSTLDEAARMATLEKIELCTNYKQYDLYRNKLESVQAGYDDVPNPNSTDAKKMVKKIVGKQPVEA